MKTWTIEDQENCVKSGITGAAFVAALTGFELLRDITLAWFDFKLLADVFGIGIILSVLWFLYQIRHQPKMMTYGWKIREINGDFQDEYLRSRFQHATTMAFQLAMLTAFTGYAFTELLINEGKTALLPPQLVPLFTVFVGTLTFYLKLRTTLDEQDDNTAETN
ncbi:hypothetical protein [Rheinheimera sp. 4Y26]|uniref:hypothetical protein n=1 Tax=Rheinheimera sp. 4Y26 TaxID=2977811 RepID=UPI0021B0D023|nr:hypothetical protein [Rheinheimera sp. 4Y26]MCT6698049.1 hypothetical protein [Rheinheimera sp. 4Y26]